MDERGGAAGEWGGLLTTAVERAERNDVDNLPIFKFPPALLESIGKGFFNVRVFAELGDLRGKINGPGFGPTRRSPTID